MSTAPDIFLSYNREDQAVAKDAFNPAFAHNQPDLTENGWAAPMSAIHPMPVIAGATRGHR